MLHFLFLGLTPHLENQLKQLFHNICRDFSFDSDNIHSFDPVQRDGFSSRHYDLIVVSTQNTSHPISELLANMAGRFPDAPILFFGEQMSLERAQAVLEQGVAGILAHDEGEAILTESLHTIMAGGLVLPKDLHVQAISAIPAEPENDNGEKFSPREKEVLNLLVEGMSNKAIADWLGLKEITIKFHLTNIFKKLGVANRTHAVKLAIGMGFGR